MSTLTKLLFATTVVAGIAVAPLAARADIPPEEPSSHPRESAGEGGKEEKLEPADPTEHFNFFNIHFSGKDEYGGTFGDGKEGPAGKEIYEEEPMSAPFILALVNFAILLGLLAKFGAPVARKTAEERHDLIKTALDDAAKLRAQAQTKLAEYEKRIGAVDAEIKALVDGIRADADADKARLLAQAEAQAKQMQRDAETRIAAEILLARATLTREITAAATKAAETLVAQKLTSTDQDKLVTAFITDMTAAQAAPRKEPS